MSGNRSLQIDLKLELEAFMHGDYAQEILTMLKEAREDAKQEEVERQQEQERARQKMKEKRRVTIEKLENPSTTNKAMEVINGLCRKKYEVAMSDPIEYFKLWEIPTLTQSLMSAAPSSIPLMKLNLFYKEQSILGDKHHDEQDGLYMDANGQLMILLHSKWRNQRHQAECTIGAKAIVNPYLPAMMGFTINAKSKKLARHLRDRIFTLKADYETENKALQEIVKEALKE